MFDIKYFCLLIKEKLLSKAIAFADKYIKILNEDKVIINHARKSLLLNNGEIWMKEDSGLFNVTQGTWNGAEFCARG